MIKKDDILKTIGLVTTGFLIKSVSDKFKQEMNKDSDVQYLVSTNLLSSTEKSLSNRDEIKNLVYRVFKTVLGVNPSMNTINLWTNKLYTKQTTLYNFLVDILSPRINSFSVNTLVKNLYTGVLCKEVSANEISKLTAVFNDELRKYGSKERALKKMISYFVKMSSVVSYCNKLKINAI